MEKKLSLIGLLVNLALGISKVIVGTIARSSAIIADGLHSGMDVISSGIGYIGIKVSKKPADKEHPYGHHKAEVIAGFIITVILFLTGVGIIYSSINSFYSKEPVVISFLSIGVVVASIIINAVMSRIKINYGKKANIISLVSDGMHDRADVLSSIAVLIGLFVSKYYIYADSIIASLVGLYILKESFSLGRKATDSLLDVSAGEDVENKIKEIIKKEGIEIKNLKTQKSGPKIFAQIDIILPKNLKVDEASTITKRLEKKLIENIENLEYVTIQITSHEISESYYMGPLRKGFGWQGRGRMGGRALGPGGFCVCTKCDYKISHKSGIPCSSLKCPKCNSRLTRGS